VWALRAQTDKVEYAREMRAVLEDAPNLFLREGMAVGVELGPNGECTGVETHFGMRFAAKAVVLTTGTFMNGTIWVGRQSLSAGRCAPSCTPGRTCALAHGPQPRSRAGRAKLRARASRSGCVTLGSRRRG